MNCLDAFIFLQLSESKFQYDLYLAEDLILKVVQNISYELDSFNKKNGIMSLWISFSVIWGKLRSAETQRGDKGSSSYPGCNCTFCCTDLTKCNIENVTSAKREVITVLCLFSCFLSGIIVFLLTYVCFLNMPRSIVGSSRIGQLSSSPQAKDLSFSNSKL